MRPVLDVERWNAALAAGHDLLTRVTLLKDREPTVAIDQVLDGTVTLDPNAASRGRGDVTFLASGELDLVPQEATDSLAPYGNELKIERGLVYGPDDEDLASVAVIRIDEATVDDTAAGHTVRVTGLDRSGKQIDARFEQPHQIDDGELCTDAILALLRPAEPELEYEFAESDFDTPALLGEEQGDRWALAQSIARDMGMELFYDGAGLARLRPVPVASPDAKVADLVEGESGVLVSAAKTWSRVGAYNRWIVTGENTAVAEGGVVPRGVATDDNPLSPTYYYGPFGMVPGWRASPIVKTDAQAQAAAQAELAKQVGTTQRVNFGSLVNPALEPGDVARVKRARSGLDELDVIDLLTVPLTASGLMTGTTRATQVTA